MSKAYCAIMITKYLDSEVVAAPLEMVASERNDPGMAVSPNEGGGEVAGASGAEECSQV